MLIQMIHLSIFVCTQAAAKAYLRALDACSLTYEHVMSNKYGDAPVLSAIL